MKILRERKGLSQESLGESIGVKANTISNYESGKSEPDYEKLSGLIKILEVTANDILFRDMSQYSPVYPQPDQANESNSGQKDQASVVFNPNTMLVRVVNQYAYAGYLAGFADDTYMKTLPTIPIIVNKEYKGNYLAFEVRGDSMDNNSRDSYLAGDLVVGREIKKDFWQKSKLHIHKWDFLIVHKEEGILLKRIIAHNVEKGIITVHSLNPQYPDFEIHLDEVLKIFNVVKVEREKID